MLAKLFRSSFILLFVVTCFATQFLPAGDYHVENQPVALEAAMALDQVGVIKQKENGYLYVEVSRNFIADIIPLIETSHTIVPPGHFKSKKGIGAHISIIYDQEEIKSPLSPAQEIGKRISFKVKEIRTVMLRKENKVRKLWLIACQAPELEKVRGKYGLSPLLKGHDFHITLGTEAVLRPN